MVFFRRSARRGRTSSPDDAGPSEPVEDDADNASLNGEALRAEDLDSFTVNAEESADDQEGISVPFIISVAIFAVSAVYFTVQRILHAVGRAEAWRDLPSRRALVLRLPNMPAHKMPGRRGMTSPDHNLSFVVPEDFKLGFTEANQIRETWQRCLCFTPDGCQVVDELLRAGAQCLGKAFTEPIPFNLIESGQEVFRNPEKPGCIAGGEYGGCAVLVRASLADFAIAVDTVGSVRIAAACCGVIGFKPTYGTVLLNGISLKSDALDTVSFIVKEHKYLTRIGEMMDLPGTRSWRENVIRIYLAKDLFGKWIESDGKEMAHAVAKAALSWAATDQVEEVDLSDFLSTHAAGWQDFDEEDVYEALRKVTTIIAGYELKCKILKQCDGLTDDTSEEARKYHEALDVRRSVRDTFRQGIRESKLVILPALVRPPPKRNASDSEMKKFETETQKLHVLASLVGCPQLNFPIHNKTGDLYSVSLLSLNKTDKELLAISEKLIPLTRQMLNAEILSELHKRHHLDLHPCPQAAQKLSEAEMEGEKWGEIGNDCYVDSEYDKAVVAYSEAIQQCPYKANFYSNRAMAHLKLMQFEFAEEDCSKALVIDNHNAKALLRRGAARKGMGMYIEAQEDFEKVLLIEPHNRQARNELGELEKFFRQT